MSKIYHSQTQANKKKEKQTGNQKKNRNWKNYLRPCFIAMLNSTLYEMLILFLLGSR